MENKGKNIIHIKSNDSMRKTSRRADKRRLIIQITASSLVLVMLIGIIVPLLNV